jgi:RNA 2',3'-cyclic 3'-phosphodiesterase
VRTFIAIELSDETLNGLRNAEKAMGRLPGVRWVSPETIHLTLKFIGDIDDPLIPGVFKAMREAVKGIGPIDFAVKGLGWFPQGKRPRVLWAGIEEAGGAIEELAKRLDVGLLDLGIAGDGKPYRPHVTLSRIRGPIDTGVVEEAFGRVGRKEFGRETADEIVLFMSELSPAGAEHTRMGAVSLPGENKEES